MKYYFWIKRHPGWLLFAIALLFRILPVTVRFVIGSDDGLFLTLGQNLAVGQGYTGDGLTTQIDFPPGYPLFAAAIYRLGGGLELPTQLNVLLIGSLLPVAIYWLAGQLVSRKAAFLAGLLTALHPALVLAQGNFESVAEQPYALLLYSGWGLLWWGTTHRRGWVFGLAGLMMGAAHLLRWEGVVMGIIAAGVIVVLLWRNRLLPQALSLFLIGLALFAIPYGLYLYRHTGSVFSPKTMLTQLHAAAIDATADDPFAFERSFFEHYEIWLADPHRPPNVLQQSEQAAIQRYFGNALHQINLWFTSLSFMTIFWVVPFLIGLAVMARTKALFLLPLFIPLAAIPASVIDPRYFLVPLPIMMIFVAVGLVWLKEQLSDLHLPGSSYMVSLGTVLLVTILAIFSLASLSGPFLYPRPTGYRTAGLALRGQIPPDAHILARKRQIPFYAGGVWEWLPFADLEGVLAKAQTRNAGYLVVDQFTTPTLRPQLAYLLDPTNAPDNLTPVYVDQSVVVYRIED